jgi:hypothetical protein
MSELEQENINIMELVKWNARGTIIELPLFIALRSKVYEKFYKNNNYKKEENFYINRNPTEVQRLIDFLSGTKTSKITEELLIDFSETYNKLIIDILDQKNWKLIENYSNYKRDIDHTMSIFERIKKYEFTFEDTEKSIREYQIDKLIKLLEKKVLENNNDKNNVKIYFPVKESIDDGKINKIKIIFTITNDFQDKNPYYSPCG